MEGTGRVRAVSVTEDTLLGGRVRYRQAAEGLRASLDPVLLAAAIPAKAGETLLEGGTGAGAALLCVAARVPGVRGIGIDIDPAQVALARGNALENGWPDLDFIAADLAACPVRGPVDHAFANPPYHAAGGTASPSAAREVAKRMGTDTLAVWSAALARPLRHRGTLTLILPPGLLEPALTALRAAGAPGEMVFPIWPKAGRPARFVLVRGRKNGRAPLAVASGLTLHEASGAFREEAEAVLRHAAALVPVG